MIGAVSTLPLLWWNFLTLRLAENETCANLNVAHLALWSEKISKGLKYLGAGLESLYSMHLLVGEFIGKDWHWEGLGAEGEGDDRGWVDWMVSLTRWTWVWVDSGSWWWTGRPGVLRLIGLQRVGHDWVTKLNWTELSSLSGFFLSLKKSFHQIHFQLNPWCFMLWTSFSSSQMIDGNVQVQSNFVK